MKMLYGYTLFIQVFIYTSIMVQSHSIILSHIQMKRIQNLMMRNFNQKKKTFISFKLNYNTLIQTN